MSKTLLGHRETAAAADRSTFIEAYIEATTLYGVLRRRSTTGARTFLPRTAKYLTKRKRREPDSGVCCDVDYTANTPIQKKGRIGKIVDALMKRAEEDGDNTPAEDASGRAADAAEATEAAAEATSNSQPAQPSPTRSSSRRSNGSTSNSPSPRKKQPNGSPKRARPQPNSNHVVRPTRPLRREEEAAGVETAPSSPDSLLEIPLSETPSSGGVVAGDPCCLLSSDHSRSPSEAADDAGNANAADEAEGSAQDGAGDGDGPGDSEPEMPPMEVEGGGGSVQGNTVSDDAAEAVADAEGAAAVNGPDLSKIEYKVIQPYTTTYAYRYGEDHVLRQTQVVLGNTCSWCELDCLSRSGLMLHLSLCHDRFDFECSLPSPTDFHVAVTPSSRWRDRHRKRRARIRELVKTAKQGKQPSSLTDDAGAAATAEHSSEGEDEGGRNSDSEHTAEVALGLGEPIGPACPAAPTSGGAKRKPLDGRERARLALLGIRDFTFRATRPGRRANRERGRVFAEHQALMTLKPPEPVSRDRRMHVARINGGPKQYYESISFMPKPSDPKLQDADSDDDVDMSWFQMQMDKEFDDLQDLNSGERAMMRIWNNFIEKDGPIGQPESNFLSVCKQFITLHGAEIRLKCLRNNFVLHLLNLVDFGLLQATDTVGLIEMVDRMRQ